MAMFSLTTLRLTLRLTQSTAAISFLLLLLLLPSLGTTELLLYFLSMPYTVWKKNKKQSCQVQ